MLSEYLGNVSPKYNIEMEGRGGILALTIVDVKIVTFVGQCPTILSRILISSILFSLELFLDLTK